MQDRISYASVKTCSLCTGQQGPAINRDCSYGGQSIFECKHVATQNFRELLYFEVKIVSSSRINYVMIMSHDRQICIVHFSQSDA